MSNTRSTERPARTSNGIVMLLLGLAMMVGGPILVAQSPEALLRPKLPTS